MAWTAPKTWTVGEIVTAANMNTHVRDNLRYVKGLDGAITLSDALILPDGAGYYLHIPILTTAQRDNLTPTEGMLVYNSTTDKFNKYEASGWREDLAYNGDIATLQIASQAQGDIIYRDASAWARLAAGTNGYFLKTQGAGANPTWAAATWTMTAEVKTGTRDMTAGSGDVDYTGMSTQPAALVIAAAMNGAPGSYGSFGFSDNARTSWSWAQLATGNIGVYDMIISIQETAGSASQTAVVKSYNADGFSLTWTKTGSPTGSALLRCMALK